MLSYLLVLSSWTAHGINNSLRSSFLEELAPESTSDSLTLEGIEDDSSQSILAQTEGFFDGYDWVSIYYDWYNERNGYINVESDSQYSYAWVEKDAKKGYFACGVRAKYAIEEHAYLTGLEVVYCSKDDWNTQYSDIFENSRGGWGGKLMCPKGSFIYGFWWNAKYSFNRSNISLVEFGFWCDDDKDSTRYNLDCWQCDSGDYYRREQWYSKGTDYVCGFNAQVNKEQYGRPGIEGFRVKVCNKAGETKVAKSTYKS